MSEGAVVISLPPREFRRIVEAVQRVHRILLENAELFQGEARLEPVYRLLLSLIQKLLTAENPEALFPEAQAFLDALAGLAEPPQAAVKDDAAYARVRELEELRDRLQEEVVRARSDVAREFDSLKRDADVSEQARQKAEEKAADQDIEIHRLKAKENAYEAERKAAGENARTHVLQALAQTRAHLANELGRVEILARQLVPSAAGSVATPPQDLVPLNAEITRRTEYLKRLTAAVDIVNQAHEMAQQVVDQARAAYELAEEGAEQRTCRASLRHAETRQKRLKELLTDHVQRREDQMKAIKTLRQIVDAHAVISAGVPNGMIGATLPDVDLEALQALEETEGLIGEEPDGARFRLLEGAAARSGLIPELVLLITLYEMAPKRPHHRNPEALLVPHIGISRVASAAEQAGIFQAFGWSGETFRGAVNTWRTNEDNRLKMATYLTYAGSPNPGVDSMTFRRNTIPLPWNVKEILTEEECARFKAHIVIKESMK